MFRVLVPVLLAGAAALAQPSKQERLQVAAPGLSLVDIDQARGSFFLEHLSAVMASDQLRVVTQKEIMSLLGMERQKQLLGCSDDSTLCAAELGAALGAQGVLIGDLARLGKRYQFTLKVISSKDGTPIALQSGKADSEEGLADALAEAGRALAAQLLAKFGRAPALVPGVSEPGPAPGGARRFWWIPAVGAAGLITAGAVLTVVARGTADPLLTRAPITVADGQLLRDQANRQSNAGNTCFVLGGVAALASAGLAVFGGPSTPQVSAALTPSGGMLVFSGELP